MSTASKSKSSPRIFKGIGALILVGKINLKKCKHEVVSFSLYQTITQFWTPVSSAPECYAKLSFALVISNQKNNARSFPYQICIARTVQRSVSVLQRRDHVTAYDSSSSVRTKYPFAFCYTLIIGLYALLALKT